MVYLVHGLSPKCLILLLRVENVKNIKSMSSSSNGQMHILSSPCKNIVITNLPGI